MQQYFSKLMLNFYLTDKLKFTQNRLSNAFPYIIFESIRKIDFFHILRSIVTSTR